MGRDRGETAVSTAGKEMQSKKSTERKAIKEASRMEGKKREASRWMRERLSRRDEGVKVA